MSGTIFKHVNWQLASLIDQIELGQIGLPDIQRPFVWDTSKVRDLFDSMYRGYPVGHLLFWESGVEPGARQIGMGEKQLAPQLLIVDGQQRLTSLFAVMKRRQIIGTDFVPKKLQIAFRPKDETFAVVNAAVAKDPSFLHDVGEIWTQPVFQVISSFLERAKQNGGLDAADEKQIPEALDRLANLKSYPFTALVLSAEVPEDKVAEVFVRINSKGKNLNQADFILTLMSVYWEEGRTALEDWSRNARTPGSSGWNPFLSPEPDQLLRVGIALAFRRGRLEDAYSMLRGKDPQSGAFSPDVREQQFGQLDEAQARVLNAGVWKEFLQALIRAGHRSGGTISSKLAVIYSYALYLIGRYDYGVPPKALRDAIARWYFMSALTSRYSSSPETRVAADLAALPAQKNPDAFISWIDDVISRALTSDFWEITLPGDLATSSSRSPSLFAYLSALNILQAPVLFSKMKCFELADPVLSGGKAKVERHHLFPRKFLEQLGIEDVKSVNQIANLTPLEWHDNLGISATDPRVYWPQYLKAMEEPPPGHPSFTPAEIEAMIRYHALPDGWPEMEYERFLTERRLLMARVIRQAFEKLSEAETGELPERTWPLAEHAILHLISHGESAGVEMKGSLRADTLDRGIPPRVLEKMVARTVAGFMNADGGILLIGVSDEGQVLGLAKDVATLKRQDLDGFQQTLVQVLASYLGADVAAIARTHIAAIGPERLPVALVDCPAAPDPVFLRDGETKEFYVRASNTTRLLDVAEATRYVWQHWHRAA